MLGASLCMFMLHLSDDEQGLLAIVRVKLSLEEGYLWGQSSAKVKEVRVARE
jgi:hypothetical protein